MGRMTIQTDLGKLDTLPEIIRYTAQCIGQLNNIINGNVDFDTNISSETVTVVFTQANTAKLITHGLNKKGVRYFVCDKSVACDIYHTASRDNVSNICLSCTVATTVTITMF